MSLLAPVSLKINLSDMLKIRKFALRCKRCTRKLPQLNVADEWLVLLFHINEVSGSNLGSETDYIE
jgi:hypothetical protein